jgi:hypothetical protein
MEERLPVNQAFRTLRSSVGSLLTATMFIQGKHARRRLIIVKGATNIPNPRAKTYRAVEPISWTQVPANGNENKARSSQAERFIAGENSKTLYRKT